jgi:pyrophosphatase PpaX
MTLKYKTVLFDLDGTLIDTNDLILTSFLFVLEEHFPGQFTREHIIPHMGDTLFSQMERFGGLEKRDLLVEHYRQHNVKFHDELVKDFPHIIETLTELKQLGVKMGVVTTKQRKTAKMGVEIFGIDQFIEAFITFDDTDRHKPDPAPLYKAMDLLQAEASSTLMVGDSHFDMLAAHNAGVHAAGVEWSLKGPEYLKAFNPEYMLKDLRELIPIVKGES